MVVALIQNPSCGWSCVRFGSYLRLRWALRGCCCFVQGQRILLLRMASSIRSTHFVGTVSRRGLQCAPGSSWGREATSAAHRHDLSCCKSVSEGQVAPKMIGSHGGPRSRGVVIDRGLVVVCASAEEAVLQAEELEMEAEDRMGKSLESVKSSFNTIRTGRANPAMLDRIEVQYYGAPTPLNTLAGVSVPDAQTLLIAPYDKGALEDIDKALADSDIGIMPNNDGEKIRLVIPQLTEERRLEMSKMAGKFGEEGKVALRNIRRDTLKSIGKLDLPEDDEVGFKENLQKLTDDYVKKVDELVKNKEKELTTL